MTWRLLVRAVVSTAVAMCLLGVAAVPAQAAGPDVYSTPGGQKKDGTLYKTSCAKQSNRVVRCKTNVWSSVISVKKGKYVTDKGWRLDRYTYLPSARKLWKKSPYAAYGKVKGKASWTSGGKRYRSECDTKKTGKGACRAYVWTTTISRSASGGYAKKSAWKLNRVVKFAENGRKRVTKVPKHVLDQSVLTTKGLGPLKLGAKYRDLQKLGYVRWARPDEYCRAGFPTTTLERRGLSVDIIRRDDRLEELWVTSSKVKTAAGARVGMTVEQVLKRYGSKAVATTKQGNGGPFYVVEVVERGNALVFTLEDWQGPDFTDPEDMSRLDPSAKIGVIIVSAYSDGYYGGC